MTTRFEASVRRLRTERPDVVVGLSIGRAPYRLGPLRIPLLAPGELWPWRRLRRCRANLVAPQYQLARFGVLAGAHRRGLPVLVWTLNSPAELRAAQHDERIWIYTTDYPRRALELVAG
jgi:glycerophosphoryl diester phosphodiesterase